MSLGGCGGSSGGSSSGENGVSYNSEAELGEALFHDVNLSENRTQSCATCHNPGHGLADTRDNEATDVGVSLGDDGFSIGVRNAPTASYAALMPAFHWNEEEQAYMGGQFLDGRASDLAAQAGGPPLNPVEMMMADKPAVVARLEENSDYVVAFKRFYGDTIFDECTAESCEAYESMSGAIAEFEKTDAFAPFDSKWDKFMNREIGQADLSEKERLGYSVFFSNANSSCVNCHQMNDAPQTFAKNQTFTDAKYFNIGVPKNQALIDLNEAKGLNTAFVENGDMGLYENPAVTEETEIGKFKVPTLRNVAVTGPYMHNGVFKDLRTVLEFYNFMGNTAGTQSPINPETGQAWAETPFPETIDHDLLGQQPMTEAELEGLECFLRTLTDERYEHLMPTTRSDDSVIDCND